LKKESLLAVAKYLNEKGIKPFQSADFWSAGTIKDLIQSRYLIGEFKGVKNYFPTVIEEKVFNDVQGIIQKNSPGRGKQAYLFNFLRGHIFCEECGKPHAKYRTKPKHDISDAMGKIVASVNRSD